MGLGLVTAQMQDAVAPTIKQFYGPTKTFEIQFKTGVRRHLNPALAVAPNTNRR